MSELLNRRKLTKAKELLKASHIYLHLDARGNEVKVPQNLKSQPALTLVVSLDFNGKVTLNNDGVTADLLFSGTYYECYVPWSAIWGMSTEGAERTVWEESVPKAPSAESHNNDNKDDKTKDTPTKTRSGRPHLTRIK